MDENRIAYKILIGKPDGKRFYHWVDQDVDGKIILEWTLTKWGTRSQMEGSCSGTGTVAGFGICGNELSSS